MSHTDLSCGECGIVFMVPANWLREKRETGGSFTCPNGHHRVFRISEAERLRGERDRLKQENARLVADAQGERQRRMDVERQMERVTTRIHRGVCPHCNRTFANVSAHMAEKHTVLVAEGVVQPRRRGRPPKVRVPLMIEGDPL
jgi:NMD protein affecting ribosome stability and mRNA decay